MKKIVSSITEVLRYYKEDSDILLLFATLLVQSLSFFTILLFSVSLQSSYNVIMQGSLIKKIVTLLPALFHLHYIYMLLDTTENIDTIINFYNKVIVATFVIFILTPSAKESLFIWVDQNKFLSFIGVDTQIFTIWLPICYVMVNALFVVRTEIGPRPKTKKENDDISKKVEKVFKHLQSIKKK